MDNSQVADSNLRWIEPSRDRKLIAALNHSASVDCEVALFDYGRLHSQTEGFWLYQPSSTTEALSGWQTLIQQGRRPRIRGAGHSMHGGSLPRAGEVLVSTLQLNALRWMLDHPQGPRVHVGAGAQVWVVDALARSLGYRLPVVHDGGAAASVGGFISAGGFGVNSDRYGGFWNHVHHLECLSPEGDYQILQPADPEFWTCFGGGGKGYLILSAELTLIQLQIRTAEQQLLDISSAPTSAPLVRHERPPLIWFTLLAPAEQEWQLRPVIASLHHQFLKFWTPEPPYRYLISHLDRPTPYGFHPCRDRDLIACGVWGIPCRPRHQLVQPMLEIIEAAIAPMPETRRYWQSELSLEPR